MSKGLREEREKLRCYLLELDSAAIGYRLQKGIPLTFDQQEIYFSSEKKSNVRVRKLGIKNIVK